MKKFLFLAIAAIVMTLVPSQMNAQRGRFGGRNSSDTTQMRRQWDPAKMVEMRVKYMTEQYKLSEEQQAALKALFTQQTPDFSKMQRGRRQKWTKEQRDSIKTARKAQSEKYEAELKSILTEEQYAQYKKDEEARMKAFQERQNRMRQRMPMLNGEGSFGEGRPNNNMGGNMGNDDF